MIYIWSRKFSKGAKALAKALGGKAIRPQKLGQPYFNIQPGDTFINWGASTNLPPLPHAPGIGILTCNLFNEPEAIALVANKLKAFDVFSSENVAIPAYARRKEDVTWEGLTVCRHKLTGHSGEGIELADAAALPDAPLYVKYIPKEQEYRIHVGRGYGSADGSVSVIAVQRKARRKDTPDSEVNWKIRNHHNGFVFVRGGVNPPEGVIHEASKALVASGLDFGAVDVIVTKGGKVYVLEINTAPGLEGQTIEDYANFFKG